MLHPHCQVGSVSEGGCWQQHSVATSILLYLEGFSLRPLLLAPSSPRSLLSSLVCVGPGLPLPWGVGWVFLVRLTLGFVAHCERTRNSCLVPLWLKPQTACERSRVLHGSGACGLNPGSEASIAFCFHSRAKSWPPMLMERRSSQDRHLTRIWCQGPRVILQPRDPSRPRH